MGEETEKPNTIQNIRETTEESNDNQLVSPIMPANYIKRYLENSFVMQIKYRVWIWYKLWPLIFRNYLGLNLSDAITINCVNSNFNSFNYFQTLSNFRYHLVERDYDKVEESLNNKIVGVDDVLDPISMQRGIHFSVLVDDAYLVNRFAEKGANLMVRDSKGYSALLKACCLGRLDVLKVLLEHGAPLDQRDPDNLSCMDLAKKMDKGSIVDYINTLPNKKLNQEKVDSWLKQPLKEYYNTKVWWVKPLY